MQPQNSYIIFISSAYSYSPISSRWPSLLAMNEFSSPLQNGIINYSTSPSPPLKHFQRNSDIPMKLMRATDPAPSPQHSLSWTFFISYSRILLSIPCCHPFNLAHNCNSVGFSHNSPGCNRKTASCHFWLTAPGETWELTQ